MNQQNLVNLIRDEIRFNILKGEYQPGSRLPSERALSKLHNVERRTIRNSLNELVHEGYLNVIERQGYVVKDKRINRTGEENQSIINNLKKAGLKIEIDNIAFEKNVINKKMSLKIKREIGTPMLRFKRVISGDGVAMALQTINLVNEFFDGFDIKDIINFSIYDYSRVNFNAGTSYTEIVLKIVYSNAIEIEKLKLDAAQNLLKEEISIYDQNDQLYAYIESVWLPDYFLYSNKASL